MSITVRTRRDRCPGALRPWPAEDGLLVRLRLIGGRVPAASLRTLAGAAERFGDGRVYVTGRANLQVRGFPGAGGELAPEVLAALAATGLLPSRSHELVRNVMVSPQTGLAGGAADLRGVARELDALICADPVLAELPARFLFVLDDGRGDLLDRSADLGLIALDARTARLRVGNGWGPVVPLAEAPAMLGGLARQFLDRRGAGSGAAWHVRELAEPLVEPAPRLVGPGATTPGVSTSSTDDRPHPDGLNRRSLAGRWGPVPGGEHVAVPDEGLTRAEIEALTATVDEVIVTPWRGILVPAADRGEPMSDHPRRPRRRFDYVSDGPAIYLDSFATIRREADLAGVPADAEKLAVRMIHGSGQVDLARDLVVHPRLVTTARAALAAGAPILCDATMVATGVTRARLPRDNDVRCLLGDDRVAGLARAWRTTRTAAAVSLWEPYLAGAVVAIGNAPTALFHLLELILDGGPRPAAIVGCPVGFIGSAESKQALIDLATEHGIEIPYVTVRGRRGGSAMTSSALNALAQEAE